jgi:hypothetical protein
MKLLLLFGLCPIAAALAAAAVAGRRMRRDPGILIELLPPAAGVLELEAWVVFFRSLYGIARPWWKRWLRGQPSLALEFWSSAGQVQARIWVPSDLEALVATHLRSALPGIELTALGAQPLPEGPAARSRLGFWRDSLNSLESGRVDGLRGVLGALAATEHGVIQVVVSPDVGWQGRALRELDQIAVGQSRGLLPGLLAGLLDGLFNLVLPAPGKPASTPRPSHLNPRPPADKAAQPGYSAELRLRTAAPTRALAKQQLHALASAFRSLDGGNGLRPKRVWLGGRFDRELLGRMPARGAATILIAEELAQLFHLPAPSPAIEVAPVRIAPPHLPPQLHGKVLCSAEDSGQGPVSIAQADCRQHIHVLGPTGAGKSTLLLNLALEDINAGRGVGVIDPKGDLVRDLLERIPEREWDRVILIDPSRREHPVGLNVLACEDPDLHEVVTDQVVTIFKKTYERYWGPRTDDLLRAALLTLLPQPGSTLCEVPLLLLRPEARQHFVGKLDDPVGLEPFWEEYERMAEGQRLQIVGPLLNKLRSFLLRRTVRNILGQSRSTVSIQEAVDQQCILLVSLSKGLLGEETSQLMGSFLVARIWQAALARASRPEQWRPDFNLYLDEFQNYLHLPQNLDDVLVEARGYHLSLVLANQHLGQLQATTREALSANARTRVSFQCGQEDARYLAREFQPGLDERDLRNLQRFQVAVRLCVGGRTEPPFTGITVPPPPSLGEQSADRLVEKTIGRWGRPRAKVEAEIVRRLRSNGLLAAADEELSA